MWKIHCRQHSLWRLHLIDWLNAKMITCEIWDHLKWEALSSNVSFRSLEMKSSQLQGHLQRLPVNCIIWRCIPKHQQWNGQHNPAMGNGLNLTLCFPYQYMFSIKFTTSTTRMFQLYIHYAVILIRARHVCVLLFQEIYLRF